MASIDNVQDISPRVQYTATASQTVFAYPFPIFVDANLVVDVDGTVKTLTTDYTVSGAGNDNGGNVTFLVGMTGGETVTIYRDISIERSTDFQQNGPWSSTSFNDELDKFTLILQELENKIGRAVRFPLTAVSTNAQAEINPIANYLNKFLRVSSGGILEPVAVTNSEVVTNADVINLLDAAANYTATDVELALAEIFETPSATTRRLLELATQAEVDTGTDAVRAITPAALTGAVGIPVVKVKNQSTSKTSDTALSADPHLSGWSITAAKHYSIEAFLAVFQNVGDFKFQFIFSASQNPQSSHMLVWAVDQTATPNIVEDFILGGMGTSDFNITTMADSQQYGIKLNIMFEAHAIGNATMDLHWAQNTSSANSTNLAENSFIKVTRLD